MADEWALTGSFGGSVVIRVAWLAPALALTWSAIALQDAAAAMHSLPVTARLGSGIAYVSLRALVPLLTLIAGAVACLSAAGSRPSEAAAWALVSLAALASGIASEISLRYGASAWQRWQLTYVAAQVARVLVGVALAHALAVQLDSGGCAVDAAWLGSVLCASSALAAGILFVTSLVWPAAFGVTPASGAAQPQAPPQWRACATSPARTIVTVSELDALFVLGSLRQLTMGDLPLLPADVGTEEWARAGVAALSGGSPAPPVTPTILRVCWRLWGVAWLVLGFLQALSVALSFAGPLLLNRSLAFLEGSVNGTCSGSCGGGGAWTGLFWAAAMVVASLASALLSVQYNVRGLRIQTALRAAVSAAVFQRMLGAPPAQAAEGDFAGGGKVTNFISADIQRLCDAVTSTHQLWALPVQVAVTLYLLWAQVRGAFLAGLAVIVLFVPLNVAVSRRIGALTTTMMRERDERVRRCSELLANIRAAKALAWDLPLLHRVRAARALEFAALSQRKYLDAVCVFLWASTPVLVTLATFAAVVLAGDGGSGGGLSASSVFTTVALLNLLIFPLNAYSWIVTGILEARVSLRRLDDFFYWGGRRDPLPLPQRALATSPLIALAGRHRFHPSAAATVAAKAAAAACAGTSSAVSPNEVEFSTSASAPLLAGLNDDSQSVDCSDSSAGFCIDLRRHALASRLAASVAIAPGSGPAAVTWSPTGHLYLHEGSLIALTGPVGSGKSALFAALLGQLAEESAGDGEARPRLQLAAGATLSYAPQVPWTFAGSLRDNVLLGEPYDAQRYEAALAACALPADIATLAGGDACEVTASSLSGGQLARLTLARALYSRAAVLLADDPTAALDASVGLHVWRESFLSFRGGSGGGGGVGAGVESSGSSATARAALHAGRRLVLVATQDPRFIASCDAVIELAHGRIVYAGPPVTAAADIANAAAPPQVTSTPSAEESISHAAAVETLTSPASKVADTETTDAVDGTEARAVGALHGRVLRSYLRAAGTSLVVTVLVSLTVMQLTRNGVDWWLSVWSAADAGAGGGGGGIIGGGGANAPLLERLRALGWGDRDFLAVLGGAAATNAVATAVRAIAFAAAGLRAARVIHDSLLTSAALAPMSFHDSVPVGRLMNRLSADQFSTDESLPFQLNILLAQAWGLAGTVAVLALATSGIFLAAAPALVAVHARLQARYRATSRELKRLDSVARSPLFVHVADSLAGVRVLIAHSIGRDAGAYAAAGAAERAAEEFTRRLDASQVTAWAGGLASQWLALRLQALGSAVLALIAFSAVAARAYTDAEAALPLTCPPSGLLQPPANVTGAAVAEAGAGPVSGDYSGLAGVAGFALAYAIPVVGALQGLIGALTETEKELVAVERAQEYVEEAPEEPGMDDADSGDERAGAGDDGKRRVRKADAPVKAIRGGDAVSGSECAHEDLSESLLSPKDGDSGDSGDDAVAIAFQDTSDAGSGPVDVVFANATVQYPGTTRPALAGLSLRVPAGLTLGIGGRTGSGKSTLLAALLRLVPLRSGAVLVGGRDVRSWPLRTLRGALAVTLPQTPLLLRGDVALNLDIRGRTGGAALAGALAHVGLDSRLAPSSAVDTGGANLSAGQRQLLAVARATLRARHRLLLVDEAASAADAATDALIAGLLRTRFHGATTIIIAHRPRTLLACDLVAMLRDGQLVEFGPPAELLTRSDGELARALASSTDDA